MHPLEWTQMNCKTMRKKKMHEPYSVTPHGGGRAYSDSPYNMNLLQVYTAGWFTGIDCALSRRVYLDLEKSIKSVLSTRVHLNGQSMNHVLSADVYPVVGVYFISGFFFSFILLGCFQDQFHSHFLFCFNALLSFKIISFLFFTSQSFHL